jgi:hypothetical protein
MRRFWLCAAFLALYMEAASQRPPDWSTADCAAATGRRGADLASPETGGGARTFGTRTAGGQVPTATVAERRRRRRGPEERVEVERRGSCRRIWRSGLVSRFLAESYIRKSPGPVAISRSPSNEAAST